MADGGFVVKFDGKVVKRCYAVAFDYDQDEVTYNDSDTLHLPKGVKTITTKMKRGAISR